MASAQERADAVRSGDAGTRHRVAGDLAAYRSCLVRHPRNDAYQTGDDCSLGRHYTNCPYGNRVLPIPIVESVWAGMGNNPRGGAPA